MQQAKMLAEGGLTILGARVQPAPAANQAGGAEH